MGGNKVKLVSPKNTSKCHLCGSQGLRADTTFFCEHNTHTMSYNADFNASVNIGIRATLPEGVRKPPCMA